MRRQTRWVFAFLAIVFAGSFVFLGVGSGGSALTDFLNGNIHLFGSSGGPSVKSLQNKVAKHPTDPKLRLQLAQALGKQSQKDSNFDPAIIEYRTYLKMKPRDSSARDELAGVYSDKVAALKTAVQSPPTPPLAAINGVSPIASSTTLGTALATLQPVELGVPALQQGETKQLQDLLGTTIKEHIGLLLDAAKLNPADSTLFLAAGNVAGTDGDITLQISLYKQFIKKYPGDPDNAQLKAQIKTLQKQLASGQTSTGTTAPTG